MKKTFKAELRSKNERGTMTYIVLPFSVAEVFGTRGQLRVKGTINGSPFAGALAPMGGGTHVMGLRHDQVEAAGLTVGDMLSVAIEPDTAPRTVDVPDDLQKRFAKNKTAAVFFEQLSFTNKNECVRWITGAKQAATRERRLEKAIEMLKGGVKTPG